MNQKFMYLTGKCWNKKNPYKQTKKAHGKLEKKYVKTVSQKRGSCS